MWFDDDEGPVEVAVPVPPVPRHCLACDRVFADQRAFDRGHPPYKSSRLCATPDELPQLGLFEDGGAWYLPHKSPEEIDEILNSHWAPKVRA